MEIIKEVNSKKVIERQHFEVCKIDGKTLKEICALYTGKDIGRKSGIYSFYKFIYHIEHKHNLTLIEYCEKYLNIVWPVCPITGLKVNYNVRNKDYLLINDYHHSAKLTKENSQKVRDYCQRFSDERKGENNPMYGKEAWNKGLGLEHPIIKANADKKRGTKMGEESKAKMRQRRAESPLKARHTQPHTQEVKDNMRIHTAKLWATGVFNRVTSIHIKMREFLATLKLKEGLEEEFQAKYYSLDFAFPNVKVAIECDGTYYHVDPRIYPNGPKDKIQRRNFGRDKAKNKYLGDRGWTIIRCWETEINDGSFKEYILCKLKELNLLEN